MIRFHKIIWHVLSSAKCIISDTVYFFDNGFWVLYNRFSFTTMHSFFSISFNQLSANCIQMVHFHNPACTEKKSSGFSLHNWVRKKSGLKKWFLSLIQLKDDLAESPVRFMSKLGTGEGSRGGISNRRKRYNLQPSIAVSITPDRYYVS